MLAVAHSAVEENGCTGTLDYVITGSCDTHDPVTHQVSYTLLHTCRQPLHYPPFTNKPLLLPSKNHLYIYLPNIKGQNVIKPIQIISVCKGQRSIHQNKSLKRREKDSLQERINDCQKKKNLNQEQPQFSTDKNSIYQISLNFKIVKFDKNYLYD